MRRMLLTAGVAMAFVAPAFGSDPPPPPQYVCKPPSLPKNCRIWHQVEMGNWTREMLRRGYPMQLIFGMEFAPTDRIK
jgi:hypothetical protein